jgi:hypothetical protein
VGIDGSVLVQGLSWLRKDPNKDAGGGWNFDPAVPGQGIKAFKAVFARPPPHHPDDTPTSVVYTDGFSASFGYERSATQPPHPDGPRASHSAARACGPCRPRRLDEPDHAGYYAWQRVVAVDPGRVTCACVVEVLRDGRVVTYKLSRARYYSEIGEARRRARAERWMTEAGLMGPGGAFDRLSAPAVCAKSGDVASYLAHMRLCDDVEPDIFSEVLKRRWRKDAFTTWQAKQRSMARFWSEVRAGRVEDGTAGVRPLVVYGGANFASSAKGAAAAPTTALYRACLAVFGRAAVRLATEHRSSKCCAGCGEVLQIVKSPVPTPAHAAARARKEAQRAAAGWEPLRPLPRLLEVRGLRRCGRGNGCAYGGASFVDRDVNAALNILRAFVQLDAAGTLPAHMRAGVDHRMADAAAERGAHVLHGNRDDPRRGVPGGDGWATHCHRAAARPT